MHNKSYYFQHDFNAANDEKILYLLSIYGMEGYGLYWYFIELMHQSQDSKLKCKLFSGICYQLNIDITKLSAFYNSCIEIGLFVTDTEFYWSERVLYNKELQDEKRKLKSYAGKKGMENRWKNKDVITNDNNAITENNKVKEIKEKETKVKQTKVKVLPILFRDSIYNDIEVFSAAFLGTQYESANFNFYYEKVKNWSDSKNNKKIDWIATAKNWMADDMANNKFIDINFNPNAKRINQDRKLTYAEQQAAIRNSY